MTEAAAKAGVKGVRYSGQIPWPSRHFAKKIFLDRAKIRLNEL